MLGKAKKTFRVFERVLRGSGSTANPHRELVLAGDHPKHEIPRRLEEAHMKHVYGLNGDLSNLRAMLFHKSGYSAWPINPTQQELINHYRQVIDSLDRVRGIEEVRLHRFYHPTVENEGAELNKQRAKLERIYNELRSLAVDTLYWGNLSVLARNETARRSLEDKAQNEQPNSNH